VQVVFLDIDGVLNCKTTSNPRKFPYVVDKKLLARLAQLLKRTKAKVVLSSTWRYDPVGLMAAKYWGVPFIDVTPDMPHRARRDEIRTWLKKHKDVTRFIVIDDDDDELDDLPLFQPSVATSVSRPRLPEEHANISSARQMRICGIPQSNASSRTFGRRCRATKANGDPRLDSLYL
jgi:hypothetical protein